MNEKTKFNTISISIILVLLLGLYYVIFIYKDRPVTLIDEEGSCNIEKCEEKIEYINESEKIRTFEDNYLILPSININKDNETIININNEIKTKFNHYKDLYNKDNIKYLSSYQYKIDETKNVMSLLIHFCGDNEDKLYTCEFAIYNIDLNNNKQLTNIELLNLYDIKLDNVTEKEVINNYLIYLNNENKLIKIIETEENFVEKVLN